MSKKSKKEEALAFLDDLDKLGDEAPLPQPADTSRPSLSAEKKSQQVGGTPKASVDLPRKSVDSSRSGGKAAEADASSKPSGDDDPEAALAYLQAQIDQKRPTSRVATPVARPSTPLAGATIGSVLSAPTGDRRSIDHARKSQDGGPRDSPSTIPSNQPTSASQSEGPGTPTSPAAGGWGFKPSFWSSAIQTARSTASSAITQASQIASTAQSAAMAQAEKNGVNVDLAGVDLRGLKLDDLKKAGAGGLEALRARVGEGVKGVDLEKLRQELLSQTSQAFTELINTVAPPISEHEVLQVWLTYPLVGYEGVKDVVFSAIEQIMLQTSSSELEVFFIPVDSSSKAEERSINPVDGWEKAWTRVRTEIEVLKTRAKTDERRGTPNPDLPITTIPLHMHLQPVLAQLPFPEISKAETQPKHLWFIVTIHDDVHSLRSSTVTQSVPADWLDVEYEKSDWVEERLVDILRNGTMIAMQEYVAVRMNLKANAESDEQADNSDVGAGPAMPAYDNEKEMEVARESGGGH